MGKGREGRGGEVIIKEKEKEVPELEKILVLSWQYR